MKTKDIRLYTTYVGKDGSERRVVGFEETAYQRFIIWMKRSMPRIRFISLDTEFSKWAKKEAKP